MEHRCEHVDGCLTAKDDACDKQQLEHEGQPLNVDFTVHFMTPSTCAARTDKGPWHDETQYHTTIRSVFGCMVS